MEFEPAVTSIPVKLPTRLKPIYQSRARYLFCKAVEKDTPEVLKRLRNEVLPAYCALAIEVAQKSYSKVGLRPSERMKDALDIDPEFTSDLPVCWWVVECGASETTQAQTLYSAMKNWSEQFRLTDEWVRDLALQTLFRWRQRAEAGEPVLLQWQRLPVGEYGLFDGRGEDFFFRHPGWNLRDDWQNFKKSVEVAFKKIVVDYHRQVVIRAYAGGWEEAPDIREQLRFKWLALWQVRGLSAIKILSWSYLKVNPSNVEKQVKLSAKQADITLRPPKAGPRKNRN
jgi:hypothetical protein